jgi:hypothetical protein
VFLFSGHFQLDKTAEIVAPERRSGNGQSFQLG